jgi:hypothetical protein
MKKLFYILTLLTFFFSCTKEAAKNQIKEPSTKHLSYTERPKTIVFKVVDGKEDKSARLSTLASIGQVWMEHCYNLDTVKEIRTTVNIIGLGGGQSTKSAWEASTTNNDYWSQFGWQTFGGRNVWAWMALTNGQPNVPSYTHLNYAPPCTKGIHVLSQKITDTGSVVLGIDGIEIIALNLGAKYFRQTEVATEASYSVDAPNFPTVDWVKTFEKKENGVWKDFDYALYAGSGGWGTAGNSQDIKLAKGRVLMSSKVKSRPSTGDYLYKRV